jgi:(2Fe-2S) ferredoxin
MKACDYGHVMVIQPKGLWYGKVESEEIVDEILDAQEDGEVVEDQLIS